MKQIFIALACILATTVAAQETRDDAVTETLIGVYEQFYTAQNARDIEAVRALFVPDDDFLWVTDGRRVWGRDAMIKRMSSFQGAEIWRVTPDIAGARIVPLSDSSALMHLSLVLEIGSSERLSRLPFLVSIAFEKRDETWFIAALMTTRNKEK